MHVSEIDTLKPSNIKSSKILRGSNLKTTKANNLFDVQLNCVLYDLDGDSETTDDQIRLSGDYKFTAELFTNLEISWFHLKKFESGIKTNQNANIDLTANLQWNFDREIGFDLAEFQLGAIPVGGVVWLVPTLTVKAYIHGDLTVTFETGISYTQELRYDSDTQMMNFTISAKAQRNLPIPPPNLRLSLILSQECLSGRLPVSSMALPDPTWGVKRGFHFQSALNADPCEVDLTFALNAILYAVVGAKCDILGLDYNKDYQLYTHPIGEWIFPLSGSGTIFIDAEPNSLNPPWTLAGPCSYTTSGNGDATITSLDPGDYTITWGAASGWTAPSNLTQTLSAGNTLTFSGTYIENTVPILTTTDVGAITQSTAQCGGSIASDGGSR